MTRIAVLADIHGNLAALDAVTADLEAHEPDEILVGGDLVGRGPQGSLVVERVRRRGWPSIRGNHEDYLLDFRHRRVPREWLRTEVWAASRWMAAELAEEDVESLESLPLTLTSVREPELRLVHGSPSSYNEGLGPWSSDQVLAGHLESIPEPLLVCCHTHRPMLRRVARGTVVNVGSVGLPFNRDRRAQYAILERADDGWEIDFRKVEYPVEETLEIYESSGFLDHGGVTARLLRLELEEAAPFLVAFLRWAEVQGVSPELHRLPEFLRAYDPDRPLREFFRSIRGEAVANG